MTDYINGSGGIVPEPYAGEEAMVERGPHGKPYFKDPGLKGVFFSRSHSKGHEVLCFSDAEVGIDCEDTEARPGIKERYKGIAGRYFTEDEQEYIGDSLFRFFEIWTAKEAYMKYTGRGFSEGFRTFSALDAPGVVIESGRLEDAPHVVYSVCAAGKPVGRT